MNVNITINCDNEAFENYTAGELNRILRMLAGRIENLGSEGLPGYETKILDVNGNSVGNLVVTE